MNKEIARLLVSSFLERIQVEDSGCGVFEGKLSASELQALRELVGDEEEIPDAVRRDVQQDPGEASKEPEPSGSGSTDGKVEIQEFRVDTSSLSVDGEEGVRVCIDFGTAMSKATVVQDAFGGTPEHFKVLELGIPGDQPEVHPAMLVSSVLLDRDGKLWFGQEAVNISQSPDAEEHGARIDNIKRRISEGGLGDVVSAEDNPTAVEVTYEELVVAYLTFLTWCINERLTEAGYSKSIDRRYAVPCFDPERSRKVKNFMSRALGAAQLLADTFGSEVGQGLDLQRLVDLLRKIRKNGFKFEFVKEKITEPVGVIASQVSWENDLDHLMMVIDVGAGTTDFGLFKIRYDSATDKRAAFEVEDSSRYMPLAGNHLDRILKAHILKQSGVDENHPRYSNIMAELNLVIRDRKESLFNEGSVFVVLSQEYDLDVVITLEEFLSLDSVKEFGEALRETMMEVFQAQGKWADWVCSDPMRRLTIVLTGGGAGLPMVRELAEKDLQVDGRTVPVAPAARFPAWLKEVYPACEDDYPRIAVSLGGARREIFDNEGQMGAAPPAGPGRYELEKY